MHFAQFFLSGRALAESLPGDWITADPNALSEITYYADMAPAWA